MQRTGEAVATRNSEACQSRGSSAVDQTVSERDSGGKRTLKHIEEFGSLVEITGFRSARISDFGEFLRSIIRGKSTGVEVQFFDSRTVATWQHLYFAALNALTSFSNKTNISKTLTMEILLYAAAERQIIKATKKMGIGPTTSDAAVLILGKDPKKIESTFFLISEKLNRQPDERVLGLTKSKSQMIKKLFSISEAELMSAMKGIDSNRALVELVIERIALVSSRR